MDATEHTVPDAVARTHVGRRKNNEDRVLVEAPWGLYAVADGVGGHQAGEVASRITCDVLAERVALGDDLTTAILTADEAIRQGVESGDGRQGMASTVVAARREGDDISIAWVGDSRAYLWDGSVLSLLTEDHSLVATLVAKGEISWEEAAYHPHRNVILQALGQEQAPPLDVAVRNYPARYLSGILLLCSDGLSDVVPPEELVPMLKAIPMDGMDDVADQMIDAALEGGGRDNISVVMVKLEPESGSEPLPDELIVWTFDPASGAYEGVRPVATTEPVDADITVIQPRAPQVEEPPPAANNPQQNKMTTIRALVVITVTALIVAAVLVSGIGK